MEKLSVFFGTLTIRFNDDPALVLQKKRFFWRVEHLLVDIVHLLALYQSHDVQIECELVFTFMKLLASFLRNSELSRAPILNQSLPAAAEKFSQTMQ